MTLPALFAERLDTYATDKSFLAADIGGTKTRLGLFKPGEAGLITVKEQTYRTRDFSQPVHMIKDFLASEEETPDKICLGVAGPVKDGSVKLTNAGWEINTAAIASSFGKVPVYLLNDLEASAYGIASLKNTDFSVLHKGQSGSKGNMAVIAPGTGLGEAGLYWDGTLHHPFAAEGGHCDFAPRTALDIELFCWLQQKLGHVSWERVISGPGIQTIFQFLTEVKKKEVSGRLLDEMEKQDAAGLISQNSGSCPVCEETMQTFFRYLAYESANLVLKLKAVGGIFIGGGIIPKNQHLLNKETFLSHFSDFGRLSWLLEDTPITIISNPDTALWGAAYFAALKE